MKKFLIVIASLIGFIIIALALIPVFFKDDIKAMIDEELNKMLNATVVFDSDNFHLTLFKNFPNVTVGMEDFGIINRAPFDGEILFAVERLDVEVNVKKILFDDAISIEGIYLNDPIINLLADEDGNANWDIYIAPIATEEVEEVEEETTEGEEMSFGIEKWEINNAYIVYSDATIPFLAEIRGLNHSGTGDFTLTVFDLTTQTEIDSVLIVFDGVRYLRHQRVGFDMTLNMDLDAFRFTFKENEVRVNDFKLGFDGWFAMPEDGFDMDISFESRDNSFKSLLSLIPAMYMEGFEDLEASGKLSFGGNISGKYTEEQMPAFTINLEVNDGMFHYPDLPASVSNVQLKMLVDNKDGDPFNSLVDISSFHIEFGNNPFDARLRIDNLKTYPIDSRVTGQIDLNELMTMFPMEGLELRGKLDLDIAVNGVYDSVKNIIPKIDASFILSDGYVSSSEAPVPLEDLQVNAKVVNSSGKLSDTWVRVEPFRMKLQEEEISATLLLENLDDYTWNTRITGSVDLSKLMPIIDSYYPMPGTTLEGKVYADITSKGKMSDLEAERYTRLPTSGEIRVSDFKYVEEEMLPQGFLINSASLDFTSKSINLSNFNGSVGRTDLRLSGSIENHIEYVFNDETIVGNLVFNSSLVDLNEWMVEEEGSTEEEEGSTEEDEGSTEEGSAPLEVYPIPENIDFTLTSNIDEIRYDNMTLLNASGEIVIAGGEMNMNNLKFSTLGGTVIMNGKYNTHDPDRPYFDYILGIQNLSVSESFTTFNTVQRMAPIARNMSGKYSTDFKISGNLGSDMMPDLPTFSGGGLIKIAQATLSGSKIMAGINTLTNQANPDNVSLSDIVMQVEIRDGRFHVKPFDVKLGNYQSNVSGSNGLDGSLDYKVNMEIPAGELGRQLNQTIASITGSNQPASSTIKLTIGVGGTYDDPKPRLLAADTGEGLKEAVTQEVKEELTEAIQDKIGDEIEVADIPTSKEELKEEVKKEVDTTKAEVKAIAMSSADSLKKGLIQGDTATVEKALEDAQDKIKNLFNRKKKKKN